MLFIFGKILFRSLACGLLVVFFFSVGEQGLIESDDVDSIPEFRVSEKGKSMLNSEFLF